MKRIVVIAALFVVLAISADATTPDEKFEKVAVNYIDGFLAAHPELATKIGDHRFDDQLSDYSPAARTKELSRAKQSRVALEEFGDGSKLTGANRVDLNILRDNIDHEIFELEQLKEADWNPVLYNQSLDETLYSLAIRDFDTPQKRIESLRKRMEAIPRVIEQAKQNLKQPPQLYTNLAIEQTIGADHFLRLDLDKLLLDQAPQLKKEIEPLRLQTASAIAHYLVWLIQDLLPRSTGLEQIGGDNYKKELAFFAGSALSAEDLIKRAKEDLQNTQTAMYETAVPLYRAYFPQADRNLLEDKKKVIKAVLDKLAEKRSETSLADELTKAATEAFDFVKSHDLVTLPKINHATLLMPELRRGEFVAHCDSPGPLDRDGKTFLEISPSPKLWPRPRQESFYREYNNYMLREIAALQLVPGRGLLNARAQDFHAPTVVRSVFPNHAFVAGWSAYAAQIMSEAGFGGSEVKMQHLKMRLRIDCNAIADQGVHAANMGEREALALFREEGFQENGEQIINWRMVRLKPAEATSGFAGMVELLDLYEKAKAPSGETFDIKKYNDEVTSFGIPPIKYLRQSMGL